MATPNHTIVYLCYGTDNICYQAIYSILSLFYVQQTDTSYYRLVVYSDRPALFAGMPVEVVPLDPAMLEAWLGGTNYIHRRKIRAIIDAIERFGRTVLFVDTDTYFLRSPAPLFDWIGPGRACLHIREGYVCSTGMPADQALAKQLMSGDYHLTSGDTVAFGPQTIMWNTGVVGVHAVDIARIHEALALADDIWERADPMGAYGTKIHHAEQFAVGYALRDLRLREAHRVVYHYWPLATKTAFCPLLPELIRTATDLSRVELDRRYKQRPRETGFEATKDRIKMIVRCLALTAGVSVKGARRSV